MFKIKKKNITYTHTHKNKDESLLCYEVPQKQFGIHFPERKKAKVEDNPWKRKKGKKKVWKMSTITRVGAYLKRIQLKVNE